MNAVVYHGKGYRGQFANGEYLDDHFRKLGMPGFDVLMTFFPNLAFEIDDYEKWRAFRVKGAKA